MKRNVYLCQVNNMYGTSCFLPYSVGLLRAYAETLPEVRENYAFKDFLFLRNRVDKVVAGMETPGVLGASLYIWNSAYTLALCKKVKEAYPQCLVVLGGPHVPTGSEGFFVQHPYVDLLVHYEGEETFADILLALSARGRCFLDVAGISINLDGVSHKTTPRPRINDLDKIPSPYLAGVFDPLMGGEYEVHPTYETDRGCPFSCSFCLSGESLIQTPNGVTPIRDLAGADDVSVLTYDEKWAGGVSLKYSKATNIAKTGEGKVLLRLKFFGGGHLDCTPDHRVRRSHRRAGGVHEPDGSWVKAGDLETGDLVSGRDGSRELTAKTPLPGLHSVYCMGVPDTCCFFAGGVLVHNCDWGSAVFQKVRKFSPERLGAELEWFSRNRTDLLYSADANFGMYDAHVGLVEKMVSLKKETGYPKKFRAAYAKNSGERVFRISKMLNDAGMSKGATLSFQSMDDNTLQIVKRKNIGTGVFQSLMKKYRREGIPTYSELIIGLPGEGYDSFADGLNTLMSAGGHDSLSIYTCEMLPNSEMSEPAYREKYGIQSVVTPIMFYHSTPGDDDPHTEHYEVVTSTKTLPPEDWLRCQLLGWAVQCFHCMNLTQALAIYTHALGLLSYRAFYERLLEFMKARPETSLGRAYSLALNFFEAYRGGRTPPLVDERFGPITWPPEEFAYLTLRAEPYSTGAALKAFFDEVDKTEMGFSVSVYQKALSLNPLDRDHHQQTLLSLSYNIPEFLEAASVGEKAELVKGPRQYAVRRDKVYGGDLESFAREKVWYGRKGGSFKNRVEAIE